MVTGLSIRESGDTENLSLFQQFRQIAILSYSVDREEKT